MYSSTEDVFEQGQAELFRLHRCVADSALQDDLEKRGYLPDMARHATLCSNNDVAVCCPDFERSQEQRA
jgi:hypothetical protein